ncbi:integrin beta-nu [Pectinophora gossypiella]|uniref:integrin beta-nu n=1 Tax=Pectinophora gossypiella TaxID=13191 RepID=UPI00214E07DD|nr:integrin beta-nu [Pectinophora gossypiella]
MFIISTSAVTKFVFIVFLCEYVVAQAQQQLQNKLACIEHEECGACLSAASHCRWCADPYYKSAVPRCNDDESLVSAGCSQASIQRPEPPVWSVVENKTLQDLQPGSHEVDNVVQIQPQRVHLSLKPRETKKISFSYRPAKNYPLDLYYLMDLTWSMKDDKETLVSLRDDLPVMLQNLTDNFKLGFGSFAEKPLMPFISMDPRRKANPCAVEEEACEATYSYRHHLSLTNQVTDFIQNVNRSSVTANLDNAEAQLDALVQVVTCGDRIGWSQHSRKIVVMLSDGSMHTAGDGLLGGATRKNDENCHLDENGYYSEADIYDYPSVAQVYRLLDKHKVNVIFAVTEGVKDHYDSLHKLLEDFTYVAKLESDSSNVLKLVKTGYEDVVSVVDFDDNSSKGPVKIKYFTDCGKGGQMMETTRCTGVEFGMTLNYEAHVTLDACPEFKRSKQVITISESQLGQDSLSLEVDIQCGCSCQEESQSNVSITCGANKHLVCGVCLCNKGWSGPDCDCSIEDEAASAALEAQCRQPNATRAICSGVGDCLCGRCECDRGYNGRFCQCKTCEISLENGMECGGVGRGTCVCGECVCAQGWSGPACECTQRNDTCIAPGHGDVCSGRGECECGVCKCSMADEDGGRYTGAYCETCPTCENPLCATAQLCVACHLNSSCTDLCTIGNINYTVIERLNDPVLDSADENSCILRREEDDLECDYKFTYTAGTRAMVAMEIAIRNKQCGQPTSARIMTSAFVIMACVIAAGIVVILVVKSAQIVSDRRAYAKFEQEAQQSMKQSHGLNPLYISPISEFRLPDSYPRDENL